MWLLLIYLGLASGKINTSRYALNILHYNDFHARFVETSPTGAFCKPEEAPCIGGFARLTTLVRKRFLAEPHSLLLNGGDTFQGTIWYSLLKWNVTQEFINKLPHDAHVFGNHEFDDGIEGIVPYLKHLKAPMLAANIVDDLEPSIRGLYKSSIIVEKNGRRIGIIGVVIADTKNMAATGNLKFTDEIEAVKAESCKLNAEGVNIIIVLSHCGLDLEREIAKNVPYVDIIVGAHSHSLLYNGEPPNTALKHEGTYPIVVDQGNRKVLIVQAAAQTQYLGEIKLYFDYAGNILDWEGNPYYIENKIPQAEDILAKIDYYLPKIKAIGSKTIGESLVNLSSLCFCGECTLGSFICDSHLDAVSHLAVNGNRHYAHFCVLARGLIRADIPVGPITYESVITSIPYENNVEVFELRGDHIMQMLEYAVANYPFPGARMIVTSGLRVKFDGAKPLKSRVLSAKVRCIECEVPTYEKLKLDKYYRVVTQDFMGGGGDGFTMISENRRNVRVIGKDYVILMKYIKKKSPIFMELDGRINIINPCLP